MEKAIGNVSVVAVRREPADASEMVTQLLYGELVEVLEVRDNFTKIEIAYDQYQGWVDSKQITFVSKEFADSRLTRVVKEEFKLMDTASGKSLVSIGSELDSFCLAQSATESAREDVVLCAKKFLNVPYLWGGKSFFGIDCSGFTQLVYKCQGIKISRDAYQQATQGEALTFLEEAEPGDLAFFENEQERITHVGIVLSGHRIIHAHGKVRIDSLDSTGIYNKEQNKHTHKLRFVRKIISS